MTSAPGVVTFNFPDWISQYPEFSSVTTGQAQSYFNRATLMVDNTPSSPIADLFQRTVLLNMATAHFAFLFAPLNGQAPRASSVVGRLSSASEGSVSAQFGYSTAATDTEAFWNQSEYGAAFWAATLRYRTAVYIPPPRRNLLGSRFFGGNGRGF